jgi:hypothetical protein
MSRQFKMEGDANGVAGKNGVPPCAESHLGVWPVSLVAAVASYVAGEALGSGSTYL